MNNVTFTGLVLDKKDLQKRLVLMKLKIIIVVMIFMVAFNYTKSEVKEWIRTKVE